MLRRLWHTLARSLLVGVVLFPAWVAYLVPWVRVRRFGATIPDEVWARKHRRYARRFYWLAVKMKGGLIKVGQILSTRVDLLPKEWTDTLSGLQDEVEPSHWRRIEKQLRANYDAPLSALFADLDHDAVAAASFGQVHRGTTADGTEVALKIKYPDVEMKLAIDLFLFGVVVRLFNVFVPRISLRPIYGEMRRALSTELDYVQEARFTRTIHANFAEREGVVVPRVIDELTTRDVICTTWFDGLKITSPRLLEDPSLDRRALLERLLWTWIQMMYVDGVFQSDPHPGNLLVRLEDGEPILCVVDFGQVKILDRAFHQTLVNGVMAFAMGNVDMFVASLSQLGLFPASESEHMRPIVATLMERLRDEKRIDPRELDFAKLRNEVVATLDRMEGVAVPQELVLYGRTFALLAGVTRSIAPDVNPIEVARPILTQALLAGGPPERSAEEASL
ncbi:MAG TPA: AarF/UbiB family protein [Sandaracinaceae bacterium LLY-WYZ-13_1]|nr:AarF/UbiB family protein [Sandaracinaceae bacterium LLY-WYZ-13_1]